MALIIYDHDKENKKVHSSSDTSQKRRAMFPTAALIIMGILFITGGYVFAEVWHGQSFGEGTLTATLSSAVRGAVNLLQETFGMSSSDDVIVLGNEDARKSGSVAAVGGGGCAMRDDAAPMRRPILLSEIAWMGSTKNSQHEWIELYNVSDEHVMLEGWSVVDEDRNINVVFDKHAEIGPHNFFLMARGDNVLAINAEVVYQGNLRNSGERVSLFDAGCTLIDDVSASPSWPAGDNTTKKTMERDFDDFSWHTSALVGGTPHTKNTDRVASPEAFSASQSVTQEPEHDTSSLQAAKKEISNVPQPPLTTNSTSTSTATSTSQNVSSGEPTLCSQDNLPEPTYSVLIHEVAWAGTASNKTSDEWIELKNNAAHTANLAGWQLLNKSRSIKIFFDEHNVLSQGAYYLLERTDDTAIPLVNADRIFVGAIKNNDESLRLFDASCNLIDEVVATAEWPAGEAGPEYRTAERSDDLSWHTYNWSGTNGIFGTPRAVNSLPTMRSSLPSSGSSAPQSSQSPAQTQTTPQSENPLVLVSEVMAGNDVSAAYEFVELYNPTTLNIDLTGWTIKKKTSTGNESSLIVASRLEGKHIAPGGYFLAVNEGGYTGAVSADVTWPASYTLAYSNNTVTIYNAAGDVMDEVTWSEIPKNQSYARTSWAGNSFVLQETPTPQNAGF